ncbi:MAG: hypothetical protein GQ534_10910 [Candidatus Delongbacteria bacterium]|nr:hypothetical protein [Candidatus Delongbacteria bacterium]
MKKLFVLMVVIFFVFPLFSQISESKGSGGPDSYGYSWIDSDEVGGPTFDWYDISGIGTPLTLADNEISSSVSLGFDFDFYGSTYNSIKICSNGYISFTTTSTGNVPTAIPDVTEPNNIIAPFWADLEPDSFSPIGKVYYYYDSANDRFVVQYQNYINAMFNAHSFQIMLYSGGDILFQYSSINSLPSNYTVGIENDLGTDGLQVVKDVAYLKSGLAIKFACESLAGIYDISTNSLDYGNVPVGENSNQTFIVSNLDSVEVMGGQINTIDGYTVTEAIKNTNMKVKGIDSLSFEINPLDSIVFNLLFEPAMSQQYNGFISIITSDASNLTDSITVTGQGIGPDIDISQNDSLIMKSYLGNTIIDTFNIFNYGLSDLDYSISINYYNSYVYKGEGGPDSYGYFWKDSDEPSGPTYDWYDISSIGTNMNLVYASASGNIPLGFSFEFYGIEYDSVRAYSNGYLNFDILDIQYNNTMLPDAATPNGLLAGYWSDLDPGIQGDIYYFQDALNDRFIVQYQSVVNWGEITENTFQIIINSDGTIEYQYNTINNVTHQTVGIENVDGTDGTQICYNTPFLKNSFAVKIIPGVNWLSVLPNNGTIAYNDSLEITATCNSTGLDANKYYADITITSNDPDTPSYVIPVEFEVAILSAPENVITSIVGNSIKLDWDAVDGATSYVIYSSSDPYGTFNIDSSGSLSSESWSTNVTENKKFYYVLAVDSTK